MSSSYAKLMYSSDPARAHEIPIGVALWSKDDQFTGLRFINEQERVSRLRSQRDLALIRFVEEKLRHWMSDNLPYSSGELKPYEDQWWHHVRNLLIHGVQLTPPRPIDVEPTDESLSSLFASVVAPHLPTKENVKYINGQIAESLGPLATEFRGNCKVNGFEGREVRVTRAYKGKAGWVIVEGLNLAHEPDQATYVTVGKLLSIKAAALAEFIIGYLSPHGLNGEAALVKFIRKHTGAEAFDVVRQKDELRNAAYKSVAKVGEQPQLESDSE